MAETDEAEREQARRDAERKKYQNERSSKEREKRDAEAAKAALEAKIERLKDAYKKVHAVKVNADDLKSGVKKQGKKADEWIGQKFSAYAGFVNDDFNNYYKTYVDELDGVQDDINREISRLQNEAAEYGNIIDKLWSRICELGRWIQNLFN